MVHVHADQLLADGFDQKRRHHGAVYAAAQRQKNFLVADLCPHSGYLFINKLLCQFGCGDARHGFRTYIAAHKYASSRIISIRWNKGLFTEIEYSNRAFLSMFFDATAQKISTLTDAQEHLFSKGTKAFSRWDFCSLLVSLKRSLNQDGILRQM